MKWLLIMPTHGITSGWLAATVSVDRLLRPAAAAGIASDPMARMVVLKRFHPSW
jgi:hypothetical protein